MGLQPHISTSPPAALRSTGRWWWLIIILTCPQFQNLQKKAPGLAQQTWGTLMQTFLMYPCAFWGTWKQKQEEVCRKVAKAELAFPPAAPTPVPVPGRMCKACSVLLCEMVWPQSWLTLALMKFSFQQCLKHVEFTAKLRSECFVYLNCFYFELFLSEISRKINTNWETTLAIDSSVSWKPGNSTQLKMTTH